MERYVGKRQRVMEGVRARIAAGEWKPGDKLPAGHVLAATYGCCVNTIRDATWRLRADGIIDGGTGVGLYVCPLPETLR